MYVFFGRIHVDESYYLYASHLVYQGKVLYRDFFFLQNPALPYVYGLPLSVSPSPYVGRAVSVLFSGAGLLACIGLARRLGGSAAAMLAAALLGLNSYQIYFTTIVRVYAPAAALLMLAGWAFLAIRSLPAAAAAAGALIGLAFDFRLTVVPALFALVGMLAWKRQWGAAGMALTGFAAAVGLAFGPFVALDFDRLWFQLVGFHSEIRVAGGLKALLFFKIKRLPVLASSYFLVWAAVLLLGASLLRRESLGRVREWLSDPDDRESCLWGVATLTFAAHFAPMFVQASYFVVVMPLLIGLLAAAMARTWPRVAAHRRAPAAILLLGLLQCLAYGNESLSLNGRLEGPFARMEPQVDYLASVVPEGETVLTSDSQLVPFLAGREILHGYESFEYFPGWSRDKCETFGVVNDELIHEHLRQRVPAAVIINELSYLKPFPISVNTGPEARNRIIEVLEAHYELGAQFPNPYTPGITSDIWVRK